MKKLTAPVSRRKLVVSLALAVSGAIGTGGALAQVNTTPLRIIVSFPPGGSTDNVARQLAEALRPRLNRTVLVENKPGAAGRIGPEFVKSAPADGSVLLLTPNPMITQYPSVYRKLSYEPLRDFVPVAQLTTYPLFVAVGPAVPESVRTVKQYLEWAKTGPRNAFFASPAAGSTPHFVGVMLGKSAGIELTHVPYRGDAPAIQDLLGGSVPMSINVPAAQLPHISSGKLRVLGTSGAKRMPELPDTPTLAEQGFPALQTADWFGLFAPAGVPEAQLQVLRVAVRDALNEPAVKEGFVKLGVQSAYLGGADFAKQLREETTAFAAMVKSVGFVPEE